MVTTLFFFYVSVGLEKLSNDKFITYSATLENTGESTLRNQPRRMQENLDNFTMKKEYNKGPSTEPCGTP